jgi:hypothetical protein
LRPLPCFDAAIVTQCRRPGAAVLDPSKMLRPHTISCCTVRGKFATKRCPGKENPRVQSCNTGAQSTQTSRPLSGAESPKAGEDGDNMTYVAVFMSCLMVMGIVALVIQTIRSAGPEPLLKISAAIVSSTFASLLLVPLGFAVALTMLVD